MSLLVTANPCRWGVADCDVEFRHYHAPTFDDGPDPRPLPSVTEILRVLGKPGVTAWAYRQGRAAGIAAARQAFTTAVGDVDTFVRTIERATPRRLDDLPNDALAIGSRVHELIEVTFRRELGEDVEVPELPALPDPVRCSYEAFLAWRREYHVEPLLVEQPVFARHYAGTIDAVARINGRLVLCDWKTSGAVHHEHHLQVSAYRQAALESGLVDAPELEAALIRLPKDGAPFEYHAVPWSEQVALIEDFNALLRLWQRGLGQ